MPQIISPGVYTIENDLSQYVSNLSATIVAMVGTADFGPSNTPTLVTSAQQYVNIFGEQSPNHYLGYAAKAFLKQGNICYITRVAPTDARLAKVTMVLPTAATPYAGGWDLVSNTTTSATFSVYDGPGVTGAAKTISLDPATLIPGFDFTDSTQISPANNKIGSDLTSFVANNSYVLGSSFSVLTGAGKNSSAVITNLTQDSNQNLLVTVDVSKFNTFNSPATATAVGELGLMSSTPSTPTDTPAALPTAGATLVTIGSTQSGGNLNLVYNVLPTYSGAPSGLSTWIALLNGSSSSAQLAAINSLVAVSGSDVNITIPLSATSISDSLTIMNAILNCLIKTLVAGTLTSLSSYVNLLAAFPVIRAQAASGIVGIGSVNSTTGVSAGLKASSLVMTAGKATSIQLFAITTGASSSFYYTDGTINNAVINDISDMILSGTFTTNLYRPTWSMSAAGTTSVPTFLKFSSIGEGDFSDIALTLTFVAGDLDSGQNQNYTVRVFQRQTSPTVQVTSLNYNDFTLIESYYGSTETILTAIANSSQNISLKIDYTVSDTANLLTNTVVSGVPSDFLVIDPVLNMDVTGKGFAQGLNFTKQNSSFISTFDMTLEDGTSGSEITSYDILGDPDHKTGVYSFIDPEQIDINLIIAPGWSADPIVAKGLIDLCTSRSDCMTILDTPFALDIPGVVNYRNNLLDVNSNYGALYYPWVKIADAINQKNIFVPPSGMVAGQYAFNDYVGQVFTAPAGRNRGNLIDALTTERILNQGDRDVLALNQINPIYNESGYGTYIRGQQTLQVNLTALDRVNVRRLLIYLRKVIATASKYYEFEPADSITALRLKQLATSILDNYVSNGGIVSYTVDVGPNVNTALTLNNNQLWMSISLVPTKTAEEIVEVFNILGQGQGIAIASS